MSPTGKVLYVIVCAAGPAAGVGRLVTMAQEEGWAVQIVATPQALDFVDADALEAQTGRPVRSRYRKPGEPKPPRPDAVIVAPATYNTINKSAQGIADTYALGLLSEATGLGIPVVVLPCLNSALAARLPFRHSVERLRAEGVRVLLGPGEFEPHGPDSGDDRTDSYPWGLALAELNRLARPSGRGAPSPEPESASAG
ncbi:flavoprotein [Streptosporangium sp. NPDC003464]